MANNSIFNRVPVELPNRNSGFNEDHEVFYTMKPGILYPVDCDDLIPGDKVTLGVSSQVQLPPAVTDFYGRVQVHYESFFVPYRILYGGWERMIMFPTQGALYPAGTPEFSKPKIVPSLNTSLAECGVGSLSDFLGFRPGASDEDRPGGSVICPNPLRFFAYHMIWRYWYRDSRIQVDPFAPAGPSNLADFDTSESGFLPHLSFSGDSSHVIGDDDYLLDGVRVTSFRHRLWDKDYFTNATTRPQAGDAASVAFTVDTESGAGSFTIASLRQANSLQQWMERNNIAGNDYWAQMYAQFGVTPPDYALDRPIYLGRSSFDVYNKTIYQSGGDMQLDPQDNFNNYRNVLGSKSASPQGFGDGSLVDSFTAKEFGVLMTLASIVPVPVYDLGSDREFLKVKTSDFAFPLLAGVGDQPIYNSELSNLAKLGEAGGIFGYTQRFSEHKHKKDVCHGFVRAGSNLQNFVLQRSFVSVPSLGSSFLEVPESSLNGVLSYFDSSAWADSFFKYRKVSTLPAYSLPSLGDPKNTHTGTISPGGPRL